MKRWQRLASTPLLDDRWMKLRADRCQLASGVVLDPYYVMEEGEWVHVVPVLYDGRLLLVQQYRYAADVICHEFPGGVVDAGETPAQAAVRELREETGYTAGQWQPVGSYFANPARQTNRVHVFVATGLQQTGPQALDAGEEITCATATRAELDAMIADGRFSQGLHIASLWLAQSHLTDAD